ncbi:hypothetical protein LCGC14_2694340, partial [marine sediment metagenome]
MKKLLIILLLSSVATGVHIKPPLIGKQVKVSENIIAAWFFNEKTGNLVWDSSPHRHKGTLTPTSAIA